MFLVQWKILLSDRPFESRHQVFFYKWQLCPAQPPSDHPLHLHGLARLCAVSGGVDTKPLDLNDYEMPIYSPERQAAGFPPQAQAFFAKIGNADALIISLAEYNGSNSVAFKNIFDWCSRIKMAMFQKKPMLLMATPPGPGGGQHVHVQQRGHFHILQPILSRVFSLARLANILMLRQVV